MHTPSPSHGIRSRRHFTALLFAAGIFPAMAAETAAPPTAKELIDKVVAAQRSSGFTARGRLVITKPSTPSRTVQFLVKGRHVGTTKEFLYLALYPATEKGRAVVVRRDGGGNLTGFTREPDGKSTALTRAGMKAPLFGSDLSIDEMTEDFWTWPNPVIAGQGAVCRRDCQIIDLRAPKGSDAAAALVRVWVSPETSLPLRLELYSSAGKLMKRTECKNIVKSGGHYSMEKLTIESPATGQQTEVDFSKGSRDIEVPAQDFTPEGIALLLKD